ncbi:MAG: hypothetical protein ACI97K_001483 [Glaciecola sp.]|jgi:hypothetical protein
MKLFGRVRIERLFGGSFICVTEENGRFKIIIVGQEWAVYSRSTLTVYT